MKNIHFAIVGLPDDADTPAIKEAISKAVDSVLGSAAAAQVADHFQQPDHPTEAAETSHAAPGLSPEKLFVAVAMADLTAELNALRKKVDELAGTRERHQAVAAGPNPAYENVGGIGMYWAGEFIDSGIAAVVASHYASGPANLRHAVSLASYFNAAGAAELDKEHNALTMRIEQAIPSWVDHAMRLRNQKSANENA